MYGTGRQPASPPGGGEAGAAWGNGTRGEWNRGIATAFLSHRFAAHRLRRRPLTRNPLDAREVEKLAAAEDGMWWFRGLHGNLAAALARAGTGRGPVLDAGCGTGGLLRRLAAARPDAVFIGLDRDPLACRATASRWDGPVVQGSVDRLPFADGSLAAIVSADVLCHAGVDEAAAMGEAYRCLMPGGAYILNLPAYGWMFSDHDRAVANARRYTRPSLASGLRQAGFADVRITYWNTILFPLMVARRKLWPGGVAASDVGLAAAPVERLFAALVGMERRWLAAGGRLPFGGSVLSVGIKAGGIKAA